MLCADRCRSPWGHPVDPHRSRWRARRDFVPIAEGLVMVSGSALPWLTMTRQSSNPFSFTSGAEALRSAAFEPPSRPGCLDAGTEFDCVVTDVKMPGMSGLALQHTLTQRACLLPVIIITGHGDIDMAVSAIKAGASTSSKSRSMTPPRRKHQRGSQAEQRQDGG